MPIEVLKLAMKAGSRTMPQIPNERALLCWYESLGSIRREEMVELVDSEVLGAMIRSAFEIPVKTRVYLKNTIGALDGVITSCQPENLYFLLIISRAEELVEPCMESIDPGVLGLERFLTPDQEKGILRQIAETEGIKDGTDVF